MGKKRDKKASSINDQENRRLPGWPAPWAALFRKASVQMLMIVILGILIYSNTYHGPFIFDDTLNIVKNPVIRDFQSLIDSYRDNRIIGKLTFAVNYRLHGLHVAGYHVVNLLIHLINALLVYWLVALTFRTPYAADHFPKDTSNTSAFDRWIPFLTALLFVSHPIQTQAVTYIVQRMASLATLFYLLSVVMYIKARGSESSKRVRYACYAASVVSAILAMRTKEIAFTLPFMIIIYEFMFFRGELKRRLLYLSSFILTIPIIPLALTGFQGFSQGTGGVDEITRIAGVGIPRGDYLITQFRVIVTYIRLLLFPVNQNLDYAYPLYINFFHPEVLLSFLFLLALMGMGIYLLYRSSRTVSGEGFRMRLTALGIFWFFVTISVESSIIPLLDFIFEHRLYLPSVGFFLTVMAGVTIVHKWMTDHKMGVAKVIMPAMIMVVAVMSVTAYARNAVWHDEITLWEDTVKKSPLKDRPNYTLGLSYQKQGRLDEAIKLYQTVIQIKPDHSEAYSNMGLAYLRQGRLDESIKASLTALQVDPNFVEAHKAYNNLGAAYFMKGRLDEAIGAYQAAIKHQADHADSYFNLGVLYQKQGRLDDAIESFQSAAKYDPDYAAEAYNNIGGAYYTQGRLDDAIKAYQTAIRRKPDYPDAYNNIGGAYFTRGRLDDAIYAYQSAIKLKPDYADAYFNLGLLYRHQGRLEDALKEFQAVLRVIPNHKEAADNIKGLLSIRGRNK